MKYLFAVLGILVAWRIQNWSPATIAELVKLAGFSAGVAGIGAVLTAGWVVCLSRLSVFEKIEDLNASGREKVQSYTRNLRHSIIWTIIFNCIFAFLSFIGIFSAQVPSLSIFSIDQMTGYVIGITLGFWLGGSIDSWRCYSSIEAAREEFVTAQLDMKARKEFLAKLRKDAEDFPVDRSDPHLNGYTKNA